MLLSMKVAKKLITLFALQCAIFYFNNDDKICLICVLEKDVMILEKVINRAVNLLFGYLSGCLLWCSYSYYIMYVLARKCKLMLSRF